MVYANVGFVQSDANGNSGAVIFSPNGSRRMRNSWFCVDPVNSFRFTAKKMSAHTGDCPKGRKSLKFSFSTGLENLRHTVVIRPVTNPVVPFRGETLHGREGGTKGQSAKAPSKVKTPEIKVDPKHLTDCFVPN